MWSPGFRSDSLSIFRGTRFEYAYLVDLASYVMAVNLNLILQTVWSLESLLYLSSLYCAASCGRRDFIAMQSTRNTIYDFTNWRRLRNVQVRTENNVA